MPVAQGGPSPHPHQPSDSDLHLLLRGSRTWAQFFSIWIRGIRTPPPPPKKRDPLQFVHNFVGVILTELPLTRIGSARIFSRQKMGFLGTKYSSWVLSYLTAFHVDLKVCQCDEIFFLFSWSKQPPCSIGPWSTICNTCANFLICPRKIFQF